MWERGQEEYIEERQKGLYSPLVGGQPLPLSEEEELEQQKINHLKKIDKESSGPNKKTPNKKTPNKKTPDKNTPSQEGRPSGSNTKSKTAFADRKSIQNTIYETEELFSFAQKEMKANNNIKRLSKQKKNLLDELCKTVIISSSKENWNKQIKACIKDFGEIESLLAMPEILEVARENDMELYPSALYIIVREKNKILKNKFLVYLTLQTFQYYYGTRFLKEYK